MGAPLTLALTVGLIVLSIGAALLILAGPSLFLYLLLAGAVRRLRK